MALMESKVCDFGWAAPDFALPDPDGRQVSMRDTLGPKGLLIAFICNHCPYVKAIAGRFSEDAQALQADGVNVIAVMSNDFHAYPDDAPPKMARFAAQHSFTFPYVVDESQEVARAYDAQCTPDFYGLNADGALQYRGRFDDAGLGDGRGRTPELLNAMRLVAQTGRGPEMQTPSMGCSIKWR